MPYFLPTGVLLTDDLAVLPALTVEQQNIPEQRGGLPKALAIHIHNALKIRADPIEVYINIGIFIYIAVCTYI